MLKVSEVWLNKALAPILTVDEYISHYGVYAQSTVRIISCCVTIDLAILLLIIHLRRGNRELSDEQFRQKLCQLLPNQWHDKLKDLPFILFATDITAVTSSYSDSFEKIKRFTNNDVLGVVLVTICARRRNLNQSNQELCRFIRTVIPEKSLQYFCFLHTRQEYFKQFVSDFISRYQSLYGT